MKGSQGFFPEGHSGSVSYFLYLPDALEKKPDESNERDGEKKKKHGKRCKEIRGKL